MNDLERVQRSPYDIQYIDNPSKEVQLAAVKQNGYMIGYINNPSEEVQLAAVNEIGRAIKYIDNPSVEVQLTLVKQNGQMVGWIKNPSKEACKQALLNGAKEWNFPWGTMSEEIKQYLRDYFLIKDIME